MDAFFAAVEQRDRPELRGRPVIVGGLSSRGVVSTASYEARRFGVRSAMPMHEARKRCPQGVFLRGRMHVYRAESRRIFEIFDRFSPLVEGLSLDEAFLDLRGSERLLGSPEGVAHDLRRAVREATGLCVSIGVAPVKLVAKIASDLAKPDGVKVVRADEVADFLGPLPVSRLWGLGRVTCERLERAGIRTLGDLRERSEAELRGYLGAGAIRARSLALGVDPRVVIADRERKSYGEESTFEVDLRPGAELRAAIRSHAQAVARRLRRDARGTRALTLKLKLGERLGPGRYRMLTRARSWQEPSDDGLELARVALELLAEAQEQDVVVRFGVRLAGVAASRLTSMRAGSLELFEQPAARRRARLNLALDAIRDRFGDTSVQLGDATDRSGTADAVASPRLTRTRDGEA